MFQLGGGSLIAERIKYKVQELNIVVTKDERDVVGKVKNLIREMTQTKPEERLHVSDVVIRVEAILQQSLKEQMAAAQSFNQQDPPTSNSVMVHIPVHYVSPMLIVRSP